MPRKQHLHYNRRSQVGGILHKHKQEVTGKCRVIGRVITGAKGIMHRQTKLGPMRAILNSEPRGMCDNAWRCFWSAQCVWGGRELLMCSGWRAAAKGLTMHRTAAHSEELSGPSGFPRGSVVKNAPAGPWCHRGPRFHP